MLVSSMMGEALVEEIPMAAVLVVVGFRVEGSVFGV